MTTEQDEKLTALYTHFIPTGSDVIIYNDGRMFNNAIGSIGSANQYGYVTYTDGCIHIRGYRQDAHNPISTIKTIDFTGYTHLYMDFNVYREGGSTAITTYIGLQKTLDRSFNTHDYWNTTTTSNPGWTYNLKIDLDITSVVGEYFIKCSSGNTDGYHQWQLVKMWYK